MKSAEDMYQEAKAVKKSDGHKTKIQKLDTLLRTYPDFAPAHDELGSIHYQLGNYETALKHLEKAARFDPNNVRIQKNLGDFYYTILSRNEDALACYRKIITIDPNDSEVNFIAANLLVTMHRFDEAEKLYENLLMLEPWRLDVQEIIDKIKSRKRSGNFLTGDDQYRQAQRLVENNDKKGAIRVLQQIVTEDPTYALAHNDLGVLRYQIGEVREAQAHYEKAVALDSDNIIFKKNLAEYYLFEKGEIKKSLELYLSILKDHPYDIETLTAAAKISEKFGLTDNVRVFCEAILDIEPWNMEASERLTEIDQESDLPKNKFSFN